MRDNTYEYVSTKSSELIDAIPLQVHRKTDYPPMTDQLKVIFNQLLDLRKSKKQQVRKAERVRKHLDAVILDLWIAANYCECPWRMISRNRNDYVKETRYRKIYLKYALLMGILDDLQSLGYIEQVIGFYNHDKKRGYQSRIKATDQLLNVLSFDVKHISLNEEVPEEEIIIKKDSSGKLMDYVDDRFTNEMRESLKKYTNKIRIADINTLGYKYDPTSITVKRIFHPSGGGRFYNGFWMNMPKKDRLSMRIDNEDVCELDYSAIHPTIAYAHKGMAVAEDPYTIEACSRNEVKKAFLVLFNCRDRRHAIHTIRSFGIKKVEELLNKIEEKHSAIKQYFYNPAFGMYLQDMDSWLCDKILGRLMGLDILCLSIHDSFIVKKSNEEALHSVMRECFYEMFYVYPNIK